MPDCRDKELIFAPQETNTCLVSGYRLAAEGSCPAYSHTEYCPEDSSYIKCNNKQWCLDNGYELTECEVPEYLNEQCPNGEFLYMYCVEDFRRACQELNADYVLEENCPKVNVLSVVWARYCIVI